MKTIFIAFVVLIGGLILYLIAGRDSYAEKVGLAISSLGLVIMIGRTVKSKKL